MLRRNEKNRFGTWLRSTATLAALAVGQLAFAGFDAWGAKGMKIGPLECNEDGSLKDLTDEQKAEVQKLVDQLMKPAATGSAQRYACDKGLGLTDAADAWAKVDCIRENAKKAAMLAAGMIDDEDCAKWILDQAKAGNICVGWGMTVGATVDIDRESDEEDCEAEKRASEQILINIDYILTCDIPCHDSRMLILAEFIRHETTHAGQLYKPDLSDIPGEPTDAQTRAALGKVYACNEIEAHGGGQDWENSMKMVLCDPKSYDPDEDLPADIDDATKAVLESLRMVMPKATRDAEAAKLKKHMEHYANWNGEVKACYEEAKMAFCNFITDGDKEALEKKLNDAAWKRYIGWLDHPSFVAIAPPQTLTQFSGLEDLDGPDINTGIDIRDFHVRVDGSQRRLLVVGEDAFGFGELQLYFDEDGDLFFDQHTKQVIFTGHPQLQDNMQIIHEPNSDQYFIYDAFATLIFEFIDTNGDQLPDQLGLPINNPDPLMRDYTAFYFQPQAPVPTIIGYPIKDDFGPALPDNGPLFFLEDPTPDNFFELQLELPFDPFIPIQPTFSHAPTLPGDLQVQGYGPQGVPIELWAMDLAGVPIEPLGGAIAQGVSVEIPIPLFRPLAEGELVALIAFDLNARSFARLVAFPDVPCPADFNGDGIVNAADLAQLLGNWGPGSDPFYDIDGDGVVGAGDLAQLLGLWGPCNPGVDSITGVMSPELEDRSVFMK